MLFRSSQIRSLTTVIPINKVETDCSNCRACRLQRYAQTWPKLTVQARNTRRGRIPVNTIASAQILTITSPAIIGATRPIDLGCKAIPHIRRACCRGHRRQVRGRSESLGFNDGRRPYRGQKTGLIIHESEKCRGMYAAARQKKTKGSRGSLCQGQQH